MVYTNFLRRSLLLMIMSSIHQPGLWGETERNGTEAMTRYCLSKEKRTTTDPRRESWANNLETMRNFKWRICSLHCSVMLAERLFPCMKDPPTVRPVPLKRNDLATTIIISERWRWKIYHVKMRRCRIVASGWSNLQHSLSSAAVAFRGCRGD